MPAFAGEGQCLERHYCFSMSGSGRRRPRREGSKPDGRGPDSSLRRSGSIASGCYAALSSSSRISLKTRRRRREETGRSERFERVDVALCGAEIALAREALDLAYVESGLREVGAERVAEDVGWGED